MHVHMLVVLFPNARPARRNLRFTKHRTKEMAVCDAVYAGCSADQLRLVYERHARFSTLPTFLCASVVQASFLVPLMDILPNYDPVNTAFVTTLHDF